MSTRFFHVSTTLHVPHIYNSTCTESHVSNLPVLASEVPVEQHRGTVASPDRDPESHALSSPRTDSKNKNSK